MEGTTLARAGFADLDGLPVILTGYGHKGAITNGLEYLESSQRIEAGRKVRLH
jgi:hypothetical protein